MLNLSKDINLLELFQNHTILISTRFEEGMGGYQILLPRQTLQTVMVIYTNISAFSLESDHHQQKSY